MRHELKCWPPYFESVMDGSKPFELRKNDRDYKYGDELLLREWDPCGQAGGVPGRYTGRELLVEVSCASFRASRVSLRAIASWGWPRWR
jgi:hypothetical protein